MFQQSFLLLIICVLPFAVLALPTNFECLYQQEDLQGAMTSLEQSITLKDFIGVSIDLETLNVIALNYNTVCQDFLFDFDSSSVSESTETCQSVFSLIKSVVEEYYADGEIEKSSQKLIDLAPRFQNHCSNIISDMPDE